MISIIPNTIYKAGFVPVKVKKIPFGTRWFKDCPAEGFKVGDLYKADRLLSGGTGKATGITVHNTDNSADAATYTLATFNQNMNSARVHFYVDSLEAWQLLELNEVGWHAGTGNYGKGNEDNIAVEIIMDGSKSYESEKAKLNGACLVAYLLKLNKLTLSDVHTHREWNGKYCPAYLLPEWDSFLELVGKLLAILENEEKNFGNIEDDLDFFYFINGSATPDKDSGNSPDNSNSAENKEDNSCDADTSDTPDIMDTTVSPSETIPDVLKSLGTTGEQMFYNSIKDGNIPDEYAKSAVEWAVKNGILRGNGEGDLMLHMPVTRQDVVVMMERAQGIRNSEFGIRN